MKKIPNKLLYCRLLNKVVDGKDRQNSCEVVFVRKGSELKKLRNWLIMKVMPVQGDVMTNFILHEIDRQLEKTTLPYLRRP